MDKTSDSQTVFLRPPVWLPIAVAVIAVTGYIGGKKVETRYQDRVTISVSGEGKVYANPDIAQISFGVQTGRQSTAEGASRMLAEKMNAVIAAVKAKGIEDKDINTQQLSLYPAYDWNEGQQIPRGFEANQQLSVKVRDISKVGDILTAATAAGSNQIGGVNFTIDDPDLLQEQARQEAIKDAREKAIRLASQLGGRLGKIVAFNEGGGGYAPMYREVMMMDAAMGAKEESMPLPIPSGEQEINMMVSITYELR